MDYQLEELNHNNYHRVRQINRSDIPETYVENVDTIMDITDYGVEHHCVGHTFAVKANGQYIGVLLIGEALAWDTDPPEMKETPFYRLMGFVIDKQYRNMGIGSRVLEQAIEIIYREFGIRPIALGCHENNDSAERFYLKHGFCKTDYREGSDFYFIRYPY